MRTLQFFTVIATSVLLGGRSPAELLSTDNASLSEGLDSVGDWLFTPPLTEPIYNYAYGLKADENAARKGNSYVALAGTGTPYTITRTLEGPGAVKIWTAPRGSNRGNTSQTRVSLSNGDSVTTTTPARGFDPPFTQSEWKLVKLAVPSGTHTLTLETLPPSGGAIAIYGYFDDFSFTAGGTVFTALPHLIAQRTQPFYYQVTANTSATFSADGLPDGLLIDEATGVISGTPTSSGEFNVTLTATGPINSDSGGVILSVGEPLGEGADQPGWRWRTSPDASQAWRMVESNNGIVALDLIDALETLNFEASDSWVEADVSGPGTISWQQLAMTGSYGASSRVAVVVDGVLVGEYLRPAESFWTERRLWIPAGQHTVRWTAKLDPALNFGPGRANGPARLDQFTFQPDSPAAHTGTMSYAAWSAGLPAGLQNPEQDANMNGRTNWHEYAFGPDEPDCALLLEGDWARFTVPFNSEAKDVRWAIEFLYDPSGAYRGGWSEATVLDHEWEANGGLLTAKISRVGRIVRPSPFLPPMIGEPAPKRITGRIKAAVASP